MPGAELVQGAVLGQPPLQVCDESGASGTVVRLDSPFQGLGGCRALVISADQTRASLGSQELRQGDWIALDGGSGEVSFGRRDIAVETPAEYAKIQQWIDEERDCATI